MNNIPPKLRAEMAEDPYYKKCCITGKLSINTKIEWRHNLIFGGKQVQEKWCILPLAEDIHRDIVKYKEKCDWIMINRATDDDLRRYSKAVDYIKMRDKLNKKYGKIKRTTRE